MRNTVMLALIGTLVFNLNGLLTVKKEVARWQYYVACTASFLLWFEMLVMIGRLPMFGKYIQMYR